VTSTGTFADKNAGIAKTVTLANTYGGADAGNYAIAGQTSATASITQKALTVTGTTVADKTADGTTAATLTGPGALVGAIAGDSVAVSGTAANARFAQADPGQGIAVDVSGLALTGLDAGNYAFTGQTTTTGTILAAPLVVTPTPSPAPAPEPATASVTAATIAPQSLGLAPVLPAPAVGGLAYLAVPDTGAADGQGGAAGEGGPTVGATNRRQSSSQALAAGREVKFLNVLVVSGGIRMPAAGTNETGAIDAPNP
jgi:hypothetical protein